MPRNRFLGRWTELPDPSYEDSHRFAHPLTFRIREA